MLFNKSKNGGKNKNSGNGKRLLEANITVRDGSIVRMDSRENGPSCSSELLYEYSVTLENGITVKVCDKKARVEADTYTASGRIKINKKIRIRENGRIHITVYENKIQVNWTTQGRDARDALQIGFESVVFLKSPVEYPEQESCYPGYRYHTDLMERLQCEPFRIIGKTLYVTGGIKTFRKCFASIEAEKRSCRLRPPAVTRVPTSRA